MRRFGIHSRATASRRSRFDRVAKNILPLFPEPTLPGIINNFESQAVNVSPNQPVGNKDRSRVLRQSQDFWFVCLVAVEHPRIISYSRRAQHRDSKHRRHSDISLERGFYSSTEFDQPCHVWVQSMAVWYQSNCLILLGWPAKIGLTGVNQNGVFPGLNIERTYQLRRHRDRLLSSE